jgi:hypothetical protein
MKRYMLFAGSKYYPDGGMLDFRLDADSVNEILARLTWIDAPPRDAVVQNTPLEHRIFKIVDEDGDLISIIHSTSIEASFIGVDGRFSWYHIFDAQEGKIVEAYSAYYMDCFEALDKFEVERPIDFFEKGKFWRTF